MRKNIKNYTSRDTVNKSLSGIQSLLASKKAEKIMVDYKDGEPISLAFTINTPRGTMPVMLPARIEGVAKVMYGQKLEHCNSKELDQVKRTAWKNLYDWVDAQMALLETEMVKMEEIFLPYVVVHGQTVFDRFQSGNLQLGSGNNE